MKKEKIKQIAEEIVEFNQNIPYKEYEAHGEPHSYKPSISVEQVIEIIKSHIED